MKTALTLFLFACLFMFCPVNGAYAGKPAWVKERPLSRFYFIGIAMTPKVEDTYSMQNAKNKALSDLSTEIEIGISSEFISSMVERYGVASEDVKSEITAVAMANIEGYELVDTWENQDEFWVYYRLSKELYRQLKKERMDKAISLSLDLYQKGRAKENEARLSAALAFFMQAVTPLMEHLDEPLKVTLDGAEKNLLNEIYASTVHLLNNIAVKPLRAKHSAKLGQRVSPPVQLKVNYTTTVGIEIPAPQLPLTARFTKGNGEILQNFATDSDGLGQCEITKVNSPDKLQVVHVVVDTLKLFSCGVPALMKTAFKQANIGQANVLLNVSGVTVYMQAEETNLGRATQIPFIEPKFKSSLAQQGCTFIDDIANADILIELQANARRGTHYQGMFTAFVDLSILVTDLKSGDELYNNTFSNIKGVQLNYQNAGVKALENAARKLEKDVLPDIVSKF